MYIAFVNTYGIYESGFMSVVIRMRYSVFLTKNQCKILDFI